MTAEQTKFNDYLGEKTVSRRTVAKAAAWSLPVIAVATAAPAHAASALYDLTPAFGSAIRLNVTVGIITLARVDLFGNLTITNVGTEASPAGVTTLLTYNQALINVSAAGAGVTVLGTAGNYTLTLPSIPASGSLVINLSPTLLSSGILALGVGTHASTIQANISAADSNQGNNTATGSIGITVLSIG
jgi:hypothetical protein